MKRILCIVLALVIAFCALGCNKDVAGNEPNDNNDGISGNNANKNPTPTDMGERSEQMYESDKFSSSALIDILKEEKADSDNKFFEIAEFLSEANGRILDIYDRDKDGDLYVLTRAGLYCCDHIRGASISLLPINVGDNTQIVSVISDYIILADDNGNVTTYAKNENKEYDEHQIADLNLNDGEIVVVDDYLWNAIYLIESIDQNGATAKVFEVVYDDEENGLFSMSRDTTLFQFEEHLDSNVVGYYTAYHKTNKGAILLENGDMYFVKMAFESMYGDNASIKTTSKAIHNVKRVFSTWYDHDFITIKNDDNHNLYKYSNGPSDETIIELPDGVTCDDIKSIIPYWGECYIELNDGSYCHIDYYSIYAEPITFMAGQGKILGMSNLANMAIYLMDDNYLYIAQ